MKLHTMGFRPLLLFCFIFFLIMNLGGFAMATPVISQISDQTTKEDTAITVEFTINANNQGGFPFPLPGSTDSTDETVPVTVTATASNHALIPDSAIVHGNTGTDHRLTITPASNKSGETTIIVTADDGSYSAMMTFVLRVTAVNDPPLVTVPGALSTDEDTEIVFGAASGKVISVSDTDAGDNTVEVTVTAIHGVLKSGSGANADITGNNSRLLKLTGSMSRINSYLDGLVYTPDANWHGEDTLTVKMDDKGHSGENSGLIFPIFGTPSADSKSIAITVAAVDDPLSIVLPEDTQETDEDTPLSFSEDSGNAVSIADEDGISGDFEVEMQVEKGTLSVPEVSSLVIESDEAGSLLLRGSLAAINTALAGLSYEPAPDLNGEDILDITARDLGSSETESGEIFIRIAAVNDAPLLDNSTEITLKAVSMNDANPAGNSVADITENRAEDADGTADLGIAVVSVDNTDGNWEYLLSGGTDWTVFPSETAENNALLLSAADQLRFVPLADRTGKASMQFRAWDGSDGAAAGSLSDTEENGENGAFSSGIATASVTVSDIPSPPGFSVKADAGADQEVSEGSAVTLNGSQSVYPEDAVITYTWTHNISGLTLSDIHAVRPVFTAPEVGPEGAELLFTLTLTDDAGNSYTDSTVVTVKDNASPDMILAEAGQDQQVNEGATVTLDASASHIPTGTSPLYVWEQTGGTAVTLSTPNAVNTTFVAPNVENGSEVSLTFKVTVSDNCCQSADDTLTVKVVKTVTNQPPIAKAGTDQNVKKGDTVTLDASASSDSDGSVVAYQWQESSGAGIILTTPDNARTVFTAPAGGSSGRNLTFLLTVTDNTGLQAQDSVSVYVAPDTVPVGPGLGDGVSVEEGGTVTLKGSEAGNFGPDAVYTWKQISGPPVELSDSHIADPTFVTPGVGTDGASLSFELTVSNTGSADYKGSVTVNVTDNGIVIPGAPDNALTFHPATGLEMAVTISDNGKLVRLDPVDSSKITDNRNRPEALIYGMIGMEIRTLQNGDTVTATIYMKDRVADGYKWYKYNETDGWTDFSAYSEINADRKQIRLTLTDGGAGDSDGIANGLIIDPSGLGKPYSGDSSSGDESGGGAGEDGGSCFIRSASFLW